MSDNIFNNRFFGREPAWHQLGIVKPEGATAPDALREVGSYGFQVLPITISVPVFGQDPVVLTLPDRALVRDPVPDDPEVRFICNVGPEYTMLQPDDVAQLWDEKVRKHVETLGALGRGERLFITTKLDDIKIADDDVVRFLTLLYPFYSGHNVEVLITAIRVVCANTWAAASNNFSVKYAIPHDNQMVERMSHWLENLVPEMAAKAEAQRQFLELLAETKVDAEQSAEIFAAAYKHPNLPKRNVPDTEYADRLKRWAYDKKVADTHRAEAQALFAGGAIGFDAPKFAGTAWGATQSVVQLENTRKGMNGAKGIAEELLFGTRGDKIDRAFESAASIADPSGEITAALGTRFDLDNVTPRAKRPKAS